MELKTIEITFGPDNAYSLFIPLDRADLAQFGLALAQALRDIGANKRAMEIVENQLTFNWAKPETALV